MPTVFCNPGQTLWLFFRKTVINCSGEK